MSGLRAHAGLLILLGAFLALGVIYLQVTPLLETPDEPSHFAVVKYIADRGALPPANPAPADAGPVPDIRPGPPVYYAPPLYYALGALLIGDLNTDGFVEHVIPNPNWARGWAPTPGRSPENKHIYVHTAAQRAASPTGEGWAAAMLRLRLFSLLLGAATVIGTYALARAVIQGSGRATPWVLAATALVAFNPAFIFVTAGVTNDALLVALSTWAFVLMARLSGRDGGASSRRSWGLAALLGLVLGLGVLTKQSALAFLPIAALAVAWGVPRRVALKRLALVAGLVALLGGWWYLHNGLAYGDPLGFRPHQPPSDQWPPQLSLLLRQLGQALQGYWAVFGWGLILVEPIVYALFGLFASVGLAGLLRSKPTNRPEDGALSVLQENFRRGISTPYARPLVLLGLGVLLNLVGLLLWLWRTSAPYGRLLFPTLGPLAVLLVLGWRHWLGGRSARLFAGIVVSLMGLYAAVVPGRYLQPAYASPVASPDALEAATPLEVRFDGKLRLLGYQMRPETARPGASTTLTLYWRATAPIEEDVTVFVQLAPADPKGRVAGLDDYLGSSRYPTSAWQAGDLIEQTHRLQLPDDVPAPALYWFGVGLYGRPGSPRWPGSADGAPLPQGIVRLGPLRVPAPELPPPRHAVDYRLGSTIRLYGYDLEVAPAQSLTVTLHWRAVAAPQEDWRVFVHLLDAQGNKVAQHDGPPRHGDYPTRAWQPGDSVPDPHRLDLPPDLAPGSYAIRVGLYRPADGTRMSAFDGTGERLPDDVAPLTEIVFPFAGGDDEE